MACPNSCGPITLLPTPTDCLLTVRQTQLRRLAYWDRCIEWPEPMTDENIQALIDSGDIVLTNPLASLTFEDPEFAQIRVEMCSPDRQVLTQRTISGTDSIVASSDEGSPAVPTPYYERRRWNEILQKQGQLAFGAVYCNGDFMPFLDADGNFSRATVSAWLNYEEIAEGTGGGSIEMISFQIVFSGDPFGLYNYPTVKINA